jgi:nicotinamide-nucleotide amidase
MTDSTAAAALAALRRRGWTLGVAESLTGGAVSAALVSVSGASSVLRGAVVAYATPLKMSLLGVDTELLTAEGPVHPEVARQMADGVRRAVAIEGIAADVGISTTGIAGPESPDGQPVGTVHIAVITPEATTTVSLQLEGNRDQIRAATVDAVLATVVKVLGNR